LLPQISPETVCSGEGMETAGAEGEGTDGAASGGLILGHDACIHRMKGVTMRRGSGGGSGRIVSFRHYYVRFRGGSLSEYSGLGLAAPWAAVSTYRPNPEQGSQRSRRTRRRSFITPTCLKVHSPYPSCTLA
jgi:hypothetical protein